MNRYTTKILCKLAFDHSRRPKFVWAPQTPGLCGNPQTKNEGLGGSNPSHQAFSYSPGWPQRCRRWSAHRVSPLTDACGWVNDLWGKTAACQSLIPGSKKIIFCLLFDDSKGHKLNVFSFPEWGAPPGSFKATPIIHPQVYLQLMYPSVGQPKGSRVIPQRNPPHLIATTRNHPLHLSNRFP